MTIREEENNDASAYPPHPAPSHPHKKDTPK